MRPSSLLLISSLSLSLTGCCMEISGGRDSVFHGSGHHDNCQCHQHSYFSRKPTLSKSTRPVRKTRPLFNGDRWNESRYISTGFHHTGVAEPCQCGGACGDWGCVPPTPLPPFNSPDCSAPQPVWADSPGCHSPVWTADPNCSSPAIPQPHFIPNDPGCHSPFGLTHPAPSHGPGCSCGHHGHSGPHMQPGPHGQPGPYAHPAPMQPGPGSSLPEQPRRSGPPEHFRSPHEPVQPTPVPPAETPVPMPMPEGAPVPAPANPVEQTSWEVPVFPPIP